MTDFKALAASPAGFDAKLAEAYAEHARVWKLIRHFEQEAHREAGDKLNRHGREAWWDLSLADALDRAPRSRAEIDRLYKSLAGVQAELADAGNAYAGWSRFFPTETTSGGHIHSSTSCHTLRVSTDVRWRPDLSGKTVDEAVAALGPLLCQVCFPEAKAEYKRDPREYNAERNAERKAAEKAAKAAREASKQLTPDEQFTTEHGGDKVTTVAACKQLIRDAAEHAVELEHHLSAEARDRWDGDAGSLAHRTRNVAEYARLLNRDAARAETVLIARELGNEGYGAAAAEIGQIRDRAGKKARKSWGI